MKFRPNLERLDHRDLPSANPVITLVNNAVLVDGVLTAQVNGNQVAVNGTNYTVTESYTPSSAPTANIPTLPLPKPDPIAESPPTTPPASLSEYYALRAEMWAKLANAGILYIKVNIYANDYIAIKDQISAEIQKPGGGNPATIAILAKEFAEARGLLTETLVEYHDAVDAYRLAYIAASLKYDLLGFYKAVAPPMPDEVVFPDYTFQDITSRGPRQRID